MSLTKRQRKVLDYVREFSDRRGYAPSLVEIARHFGLRSPATVHKHLSNLEAKGMLRRRWNHTRAIEVIPEPGTSPSYDLPLAGTLSSSAAPRLDGPSEFVPVPAAMAGTGRPYVLRVAGDGFAGDLLCDGDLVVVDEGGGRTAGAVVLAVVGGVRSMLRRVEPSGDGILLRPLRGEDREPAPPQASYRVLGRVLGVLRQY